MIFGTGIDIIDISRIKKAIDNNDGFVKKVFTSSEVEYCNSKKKYAESFAARFAAKEAFLKAIGIGWRDGIGFSDVEVCNNELGKPELVLHNLAHKFCEDNNIGNISVSLSHSKDLATAIVILETF